MNTVTPFAMKWSNLALTGRQFVDSLSQRNLSPSQRRATELLERKDRIQMVFVGGVLTILTLVVAAVS